MYKLRGTRHSQTLMLMFHLENKKRSWNTPWESVLQSAIVKGSINEIYSPWRTRMCSKIGWLHSRTRIGTAKGGKRWGEPRCEIVLGEAKTNLYRHIREVNELQSRPDDAVCEIGRDVNLLSVMPSVVENVLPRERTIVQFLRNESFFCLEQVQNSVYRFLMLLDGLASLGSWKAT